MGLFSKKAMVCEKCGKEFETRFAFGGSVCSECQKKEKDEKKALLKQVQGYVDYQLDAGLKELSAEEMRLVIAHRELIMAKNSFENPLSANELSKLGSSHDGLSDEQCKAILKQAGAQKIYSDRFMGCAFTNTLLLPLKYSNVVVDMEDVFAVAYCTSMKASSKYKSAMAGIDPVLCAVFTNDPYVPVLPVLMFGRVGLFSMRSKQARNAAEELFSAVCPNLTYPVCSLKELKKMVKAESTVRGNMEKDFMMNQISDADLDSGIFNPDRYDCKELNYDTSNLMKEHGYLPEEEIDKYLGMNNKVFDKFWKKKAEELM